VLGTDVLVWAKDGGRPPGRPRTATRPSSTGGRPSMVVVALRNGRGSQRARPTRCVGQRLRVAVVLRDDRGSQHPGVRAALGRCLLPGWPGIGTPWP